jgi:hypothetical protein
MLRPFAVLMLTTVLAGASGCGNDDTPTAPTDSGPTTTTEVWAGTLEVRGAGFFSFSVQSTGATGITFGSLVDTRSGRPLETSVGLALGVPRREECELTTSITASPALTAQISTALNPGIYCVHISDVGNLRAAAAFGVRIVHP